MHSIPPYSRNNSTNQQVWCWHERLRIFSIVREADCLTPGSIELQRQELAEEADRVMRILEEENSRGELTKAGAREVAHLINRTVPAKRTHPDPDTTRYYTASNNKLVANTVKGKRRKELDAEQLAFAIVTMARHERNEAVPTEYATLEDVKRAKEYEANMRLLGRGYNE